MYSRLKIGRFSGGTESKAAREVGEKAVQFAMWGTKDGSVAIRRTGFYSCDYNLVWCPKKIVCLTCFLEQIIIHI